MFIPKVWFEGEKLRVEVNPNEVEKYGQEPHWIDLQIGLIIRIKQQEHTVYVQGERQNAIVTEVYSTEKIRALSPCSVDVPDWMKAEFEKFINDTPE